MASFDIAVMARRIGTNEFVTDIQTSSCLCEEVGGETSALLLICAKETQTAVLINNCTFD